MMSNRDSHQSGLPLAITQQEAIKLLRAPKIFKRALAAGWIKPVIQGGQGRRSLFDYQDILKLWERLKQGEQPPLLPCEKRIKGIKEAFCQLWQGIIEQPSRTPANPSVSLLTASPRHLVDMIEAWVRHG